VPHAVEIWEIVSGGRVPRLASCLSCGWRGVPDIRLAAEAEAARHEGGESSAPRAGELPHPPPPATRLPSRPAHDMHQ
jgi:hypothetical protein